MKYAVIVFVVILLLPVFIFVVAAPVVDEIHLNKGRSWSRDIGCGNYSGRAEEICHSISHAMEGEWLGHAVIAPGWRVTFETLRRVYCEKKINISDIPALKEMEGYKPFKPIDSRLEFGALGLLVLLRDSPEGKNANLPDSAYDEHTAAIYGWSRSGTGSNSIFNPDNPNYILRGGCPDSNKNPD